MSPPPPAADGLAGGLLGFGMAAALVFRTWPPIAFEAARRTLVLAVPAGAAAVFLLRSQPAGVIFAGLMASLAALSLFGAEGSRANTEAGWRRGASWAGAVALASALAALLFRWLGESPSRNVRVVAAVSAVLALLAWGPAMAAEWTRVRRELREEVRLGLMPAEDAAVLALPWRRVREPRFGRPDERREYVRSALLLAVAHRQQRSRDGEAARLRQLEVLAFRTRLRRTLEARASRAETRGPDLDGDAGI